MDKQGKKVLKINFLILLVYSVLLSFTGDDGHLGQLAPLLFKAYAVGLHFIVAIVTAIMYYVRENKMLGKWWLFSALMIALVGFSFCVVPSVIIENL